MTTPAKDKIILPLDVADTAAAMQLLSRIGDRVGLYKIGLELFTAAGPDIVRAVRGTGAGVFLDLKFHDIPNTVRGAIRSTCALDVQMTTIHLSGGPEMAQAAAEAAAGSDMLVLGVTVLTSSDPGTLAACGIDCSLEEQVLRLAGIASVAGLGGIVASPKEIVTLRERFGDQLRIVTPGVRPAWAEAQDQKRILSPKEAVAAGADYLVIGRPITNHPDPLEAIARIVEEIESA